MTRSKRLSAPARALLLIDAGNTRIKWAWVDRYAEPLSMEPGAVPWQHTGVQPHDRLDALAQDWRHCAADDGAAMPEVWISAVASLALRDALRARVAGVFGGAPVRVIAPQVCAAGLRNGYRAPAQLGADRWASAVGARQLWPDAALLLVTAGTATTLDIVTPDGLFAGGLILPGLTLMTRALAQHTAQLPEISADHPSAHAWPASAWADNTHDAIALGCMAAQAGAIAQTWAALRSRYPGPAHCVLSGGARAALAHALRMPFQMHDNLVLLGLQVLARASDSPPARPA